MIINTLNSIRSLGWFAPLGPRAGRQCRKELSSGAANGRAPLSCCLLSGEQERSQEWSRGVCLLSRPPHWHTLPGSQPQPAPPRSCASNRPTGRAGGRASGAESVRKICAFFRLSVAVLSPKWAGKWRPARPNQWAEARARTTDELITSVAWCARTCAHVRNVSNSVTLLS